MKLKLIEKRVEARDTKSFFWLPEEPVFYKPGQYFYYTLPYLNYPDERGLTRHFTISSSVVETRLLRFTTRMRKGSGFKNTLDELPLGTEVQGQGPNGTFVLDEEDKSPRIYVAGGIGVTTFRSMINYSLIQNLNIPTYLYYSDSNEDEFAFIKELTEWDKNYDIFKMKQIVTSKEGRIDNQKMNEFIKYCNSNTLATVDPSKCSWWICGSPSFVDNVWDLLEAMKIPGNNIRSEKFTGY